MSATKFFHENAYPPRPLSETEKQTNAAKGMLELAKQIDQIQQAMRNLEHQFQAVQIQLNSRN